MTSEMQMEQEEAVVEHRRVERVLSGRAARAALTRGVTLVEVLIVVAIMAVIAGGATIMVFPRLKEARIKNAIIGAGTIKKAAELHINMGGAEGCPTIADLVAAKMLDGSKTDDPWGKPYKIVCAEGGDIKVTSAGNDKQDNTADDVHDAMKDSDVKKLMQ
ncbi:MAG: type II secretion system protein [Polyangiaceae bacterium]